MNFSERSKIAFLELLSTVTCFTEGLLKNNFNYLFRTGNTFHDFPGR
jgi:hypothetical protein